MFNRRKFLKASVLTSGAFLLDKNLIAQTLQSNIKTTHQPIVISTWDFGVAANAAAWSVLSTGGQAIDAVEKGVKVAEADVNNASVGYGGLPDREGIVSLDACIMHGNGDCGAVLALERIKHPISVARMVMEKTPHVMLAGEGALQFAIENGFKSENLLTDSSKQAWQEWLKKSEYKPSINIENSLYYKTAPDKLPGNKYNHDTIGMLALDAQGNLSAACTTSGMAYKLHGRVGDSPIVGAGLYADHEVGAATATGVGEEVVRNVGSFLVVELMRQGYTPAEACQQAVMRIIKRKPEKAAQLQVGFIALDKQGNYGAYAIQSGFSYAVCHQQQQNLLLKSKSYYS
jgi:N4-(beta-N-acetylglucosaminyl)-L-asparaginase